MPTQNKEKILFLTGKLAEKRIKRVLESMQASDFDYEVRNIGVSVAALMTASMIKRRLTEYEQFDRVIVPGLCGGDLEKVGNELNIMIQRGPVDLKDLPEFFGQKRKKQPLDHFTVKIFAEIVDAPLISVDEIIARAVAYRSDGADVIDLGCLPDTPFPHLEESVLALKSQGFRVSVDSLDSDELLRGGKAGADYLLSLKESTCWIAEEVASTPVLIPDTHMDMASLYRLMDSFLQDNRPFIADSILDPIHFGFTRSILRYAELRDRYPDIEIMMGTGNLTELTEADTTGINALLFGVISELDISQVLVTQVSPHARSVVKESDRARRIMYIARQDECLPKDIDDGLLTTHARNPFPDTCEEIREIAAEIRDPSYRIQISEAGIHVYNREGFYSGKSPFELFDKLVALQDDAPHAFYMGVELARAEIAWQLGKRYYQDEMLEWGVATDSNRGKHDAELNITHAMRKNTEYKQAGSTLKTRKSGKNSSS